MAKSCLPHWRSIHTIVFDFDGVFTDNKVWTDEHGVESVRCDRADGLAFDLLRNFVKIKSWQLNYFILSKEVNDVVASRANKIKVPFVQGITNKRNFLLDYLRENNLGSSGLLYIGNDLNDLGAMKLAGCSVAPSDAHPLILDHASVILIERGGEGFVRSLIERLLCINQMSEDDLINFF